jgi:hypothetical protein
VKDREPVADAAALIGGACAPQRGTDPLGNGLVALPCGAPDRRELLLLEENLQSLSHMRSIHYSFR